MPRKPKRLMLFLPKNNFAFRTGTGTGKRGKGKKGEPLYGDIWGASKYNWTFRRND